MTGRDLAVAQVQVGPADAAGAHAQAHLARPGLRHVDLGGAQRRPGRSSSIALISRIRVGYQPFTQELVTDFAE